MSLVNLFLFVGYMPEKPELQKTKSGTSVVEFSLPTQSQQKDEDGHNKSDWHRLTAYGQIAENINRYNNKGDMVSVMGNVREDRWKTDRGETKYRTVFVVDQFKTLKRAEPKAYTDAHTSGEISLESDDLPF